MNHMYEFLKMMSYFFPAFIYSGMAHAEHTVHSCYSACIYAVSLFALQSAWNKTSFVMEVRVSVDWRITEATDAFIVNAQFLGCMKALPFIWLNANSHLKVAGQVSPCSLKSDSWPH